MTDLFFHLIVICIAALGIYKGYRSGFVRQVPALIGLCFGVLCSYIFRFPVEEYISGIMAWEKNKVECGFVTSNVSCALIFLIVSSLFQILTTPLKFFLSIFETGMLDSIAGALLGLLRYTLLVSIFLNILLCFNIDSRLLKYARSDDGDIVHETMLLAPWFLGSESIDDLVHKIQLEEAKTIS